MIKIFKLLAKRELALTCQRLDQILLPLLFNFLLFFIALLILEKYSFSREKIIYSLMLITSTLTLGFSKILSFEEDFKSGLLERFFLLPVKPYYIILFKGFLSLIKYLFIITIFYLVLYLLLLENFWSFYYKLLIINIYLGLIAFSLNLISLKIKQNFFTSIALLILVFPQLLITLLAINQEVYLLLLLAFIIIFLPLVLFLLYLILPSLVKN
jgi:hypothetical protein